MISDDQELKIQVQEEIAELLPDNKDEAFEGLTLTPQECLFAFRYVELNDAVEAYKISFGTTDYKKALAQGTKLAKKKDIIEACKRLRDEIWTRANQILPIKLLQNIEAVQNLDPLDFYTADGEARLLDSIPAEKRRLINNITIMCNSKTGERYMLYDLPNKASVTKTLMDLIKVRSETGGITEDKNTMAEASAKVAEIFGSLKNETNN